jgi:hypothetical protein
MVVGVIAYLIYNRIILGEVANPARSGEIVDRSGVLGRFYSEIIAIYLY